LVNATIKRLTRILCRVDDEQVVRIPTQGPLIIVSNHVSNHINFLEPLVVYTHLLPRPMAFFAKVESWDNKLIGFVFDMWGGIPLKRGSADIGAIRLGLEALENGTILAVAPEGTERLCCLWPVTGTKNSGITLPICDVPTFGLRWGIPSHYKRMTCQ